MGLLFNNNLLRINVNLELINTDTRLNHLPFSLAPVVMSGYVNFNHFGLMETERNMDVFHRNVKERCLV